ncbi:hypothetical protein [Pseudodesulfovibrio karagichevae]|uniref:RecT family protein n=1 Tax=Pseudodesulfovibrio karagichevae TaxID=3239305 RepID=A0ABV4K0A3_9BACT
MATQTNVSIGMMDSQSYALTRSIAKDLAASDLVPQRFKGNAPNCMIALNMSARIGADPMMVMQNLYVVHGTPGWSSQFLIATFNHNPKFSALRYEFKGSEGADGWACRAWAIEKETNEKLYGAWVSIGLAKKEGWYGKNGSKWQTMPQQMLMYRSASWFIRAYAPEIAMGLQTAEEVSDTIDLERQPSGTYSQKQTLVDERNTQQPIDNTTQPEDPEAAFFGGSASQDEPPAEQQEQPAEEQGAGIDPTDEIAVAEFVLSGEDLGAYKDANAAEKKKKCLGYIQSFGAQVADAERLVGKGYAQWTTKDRAALLGAYSQLANGADPAEVFPTA